MSGRLGMTGDWAPRGDARVMKSYVPGRGWVSASKLPKGQLRSLAHGGRAAQTAENRYHDEMRGLSFQMHAEGVRGLMAERGVPHQSKGRVHMLQLSRGEAKQMIPGMTAAHVRTGSAKHGSSMVIHKPSPDPEILAHEHAHGTPKRSGYRMYQVAADPKRAAREEARADFMAGERHTSPSQNALHGVYSRAASDPEYRRKMHRQSGSELFSSTNMAHYRRVQDKMAASQRRKAMFGKVETTMTDTEAKRLAGHYDTRGPLPKGLSRETKMKAYEARYIASGGRKAERWKRRANVAEVGRNTGLAGATLAAGGFLATKGRRTGPTLRKIPKIGRHMTHHKVEAAGAASGAFGGASELYGEYARRRRASYQNSPAGVAGSALSRMRAYTPEAKP